MNARKESPLSENRETVLEVSHVHKWFGGLHALDDVSFSVRRGESVGLVGDNGAGKSTLLKTLSGVHEPTEGRIVLEGSEVKLASPNVARSHGVETVYQDLALIGRFSIAENFFLGRELRQFGFLRKRAMRAATDEALRNLDVRVPFANRRVSKMSGGQRQAVAIARGAYWGKKMLLLDEPTAALGVRESGEVLRLLDSLKEGGITTILVTHNIDHLWHVCDRILVLRRGRLVADVAKSEVTPAEVVGHITGAIEARNGEPGTEQVAADFAVNADEPK
jgi:simple sugar transport system ATP-binding protein/D-xylose transport system ATP-binding protein